MKPTKSEQAVREATEGIIARVKAMPEKDRQHFVLRSAAFYALSGRMANARNASEVERRVREQFPEL